MTTDATTIRAERWPLLRLLWVAPVVAGVLAAAHGFREPLAWAATQAQFTCDLIPKRCAFGQALAWAHVPVAHYAVFSALSTTLLVAAALAYAGIAARSALARSPAGVGLLIALAGSLGVTVLAAINGYLDIPMALLAAAICAPARTRPWVAAAGALIGVALHEAYLLAFLPVTVLPLLLSAKSWRDLWRPAAALVVGFLTAVVLALGKPLSPAALGHVGAVIQSRVDFGIDPAAILVMGRSLGDNLHMMGRLIHTSWWVGQAIFGLAVILPPGALFAWAVLGGLRAPLLRKGLILACGLAPLSLNLIGFDTWRWSALCIPTMLLAAVAGVRTYGPVQVRAAPLFVGIAVMLCPLPLLLPRPLSHNPSLGADVNKIISATD